MNNSYNADVNKRLKLQLQKNEFKPRDFLQLCLASHLQVHDAVVKALASILRCSKLGIALLQSQLEITRRFFSLFRKKSVWKTHAKIQHFARKEH